MDCPSRRLKPLSEVSQGMVATVVKIKLDEKNVARLTELGLRRGAEVKVLFGNVDNSLLLGVGDGRIGVNYDVAERIFVY